MSLGGKGRHSEERLHVAVHGEWRLTGRVSIFTHRPEPLASHNHVLNVPFGE